jgi:hypothetical protein
MAMKFLNFPVSISSPKAIRGDSNEKLLQSLHMTHFYDTTSMEIFFPPTQQSIHHKKNYHANVTKSMTFPGASINIAPTRPHQIHPKRGT